MIENYIFTGEQGKMATVLLGDNSGYETYLIQHKGSRGIKATVPASKKYYHATFVRFLNSDNRWQWKCEKVLPHKGLIGLSVWASIKSLSLDCSIRPRCGFSKAPQAYI